MGDLIIDVHHFGRGRGRSIEGGVPVATHERTATSRGGAGLVVRNLEALGAPVKFFTAPAGVVKERFVIDGAKVLRWNRGGSKPVSKAFRQKLLAQLKKVLPRARVVLVADYRHGLISKRLATTLVALARRAGKEIWVDSQVAHHTANHAWYAGATLLCFNEAEAKKADPRFDSKKLEQSLRRLQKMFKARHVIVKLGARGSAARVDGEHILTAATKVKAVDAVGAGDAFFAALAYRGLSKEGLAFASRWAALAATIRGTEPPKRAMLKRLKK